MVIGDGEVEFTVAIKEAAGKGAARKIRATGMVPGILYGYQEENKMISFEERALVKVKIGERAITPQEISAHVLAELKRRASEGLGTEADPALRHRLAARDRLVPHVDHAGVALTVDVGEVGHQATPSGSCTKVPTRYRGAEACWAGWARCCSAPC